MSYCRFRNTLRDLRDCLEHITDDLSGTPEEEDARSDMLYVCEIIQCTYYNRKGVT